MARTRRAQRGSRCTGHGDTVRTKEEISDKVPMAEQIKEKDQISDHVTDGSKSRYVAQADANGDGWATARGAAGRNACSHMPRARAATSRAGRECTRCEGVGAGNGEGTT